MCVHGSLLTHREPGLSLNTVGTEATTETDLNRGDDVFVAAALLQQGSDLVLPTGQHRALHLDLLPPQQHLLLEELHLKERPRSGPQRAVLGSLL